MKFGKVVSQNMNFGHIPERFLVLGKIYTPIYNPSSKINKPI